MKKIGLALLVVLILINSSCKSNKLIVEKVAQSEVNYIPYYLKVYEAKDYYDSKDFEKSFALLDSLFQKFEPIETPTIYEMDIYCELAVKLKKYERIRSILPIMIIKYGRTPYLAFDENNFWKDIILHSEYKKTDFEKFHNEYLSNISYTLKDSIVEMYKGDQIYRSREKYNTQKYDSVDKINREKLLYIIKKYGFPREKIIGGMEIDNPVKPNYLGVLIMHINYDYYRINLESSLFQELKKGNLTPFDYGSMLDKFYLGNRDKIKNYTYLGMFSKVIVEDTTKTNQARALIGLPDINVNINN